MNGSENAPTCPGHRRDRPRRRGGCLPVGAHGRARLPDPHRERSHAPARGSGRDERGEQRLPGADPWGHDERDAHPLTRACTGMSSSPYTLTVEDIGLDAQGDTAGTATPIVLGESVSGVLEHDADIDMLRFMGTPGMVYRVSASMDAMSRDFASRISPGRPWPRPRAGRARRRSSVNPPPVRSSSGCLAAAPATTTWTVELQELGPDDHGDSESTGTTVTVPVAGMAGVLSHTGDIDVFRFDPQAQRLYRITCAPATTSGCRLTAQQQGATLATGLGELVVKSKGGSAESSSRSKRSSAPASSAARVDRGCGGGRSFRTCRSGASPLPAESFHWRAARPAGDWTSSPITASRVRSPASAAVPEPPAAGSRSGTAQGTLVANGSTFSSGDLIAFQARRQRVPTTCSPRLAPDRAAPTTCSSRTRASTTSEIRPRRQRPSRRKPR